MTRKAWVALVAFSVGLTGACTDLLVEDPQGFTTTDTFYKTGADLNSATIAIYNALRGLQGQANWTAPELASDMARAARYRWRLWRCSDRHPSCRRCPS